MLVTAYFIPALMRTPSIALQPRVPEFQQRDLASNFALNPKLPSPKPCIRTALLNQECKLATQAPGQKPSNLLQEALKPYNLLNTPTKLDSIAICKPSVATLVREIFSSQAFRVFNTFNAPYLRIRLSDRPYRKLSCLATRSCRVQSTR